MKEEPDPDLGHLITFDEGADKVIALCRWALILFAAFCVAAMILY